MMIGVNPDVVYLIICIIITNSFAHSGASQLHEYDAGHRKVLKIYFKRDCRELFKKNGSLEELSQQQIVDCSVLYGNLGCQGGSFSNTARYLQRHGLLPKHKYPPYKAKQSVCRALLPKSHEAVKVKRWGVLPPDDETALKIAVAKIGPVAVSVDASSYTFQLYHSGVYDDPSCTGDTLNHAMLLVGYTRDAWILKNWWSSRWGQGGYMQMRRGKNRCGIASYAVYMTLD